MGIVTVQPSGVEMKKGGGKGRFRMERVFHLYSSLVHVCVCWGGGGGGRVQLVFSLHGPFCICMWPVCGYAINSRLWCFCASDICVTQSCSCWGVGTRHRKVLSAYMCSLS